MAIIEKRYNKVESIKFNRQAKPIRENDTLNRQAIPTR